MVTEKRHSFARLKSREARVRRTKLRCEERSYDAKLGCEIRMRS